MRSESRDDYNRLRPIGRKAMSKPVTLIACSMIRSRLLDRVAEALYQTVTMDADVKLADLPPIERQRYQIAANRCWEHVNKDLLRLP